jgi:hypothetical protein
MIGSYTETSLRSVVRYVERLYVAATPNIFPKTVVLNSFSLSIQVTSDLEERRETRSRHRLKSCLVKIVSTNSQVDA